MSIIRILDPTVANQIAAGEVVERPAAVVKELLENALDAGATRVVVDFSRGGKALTVVEDNGKGMTPEEALLSLERHATSKIRLAADLDRITTFGFRGEALPSIASVARFTLQTRPASAPSGTELLINGGRVVHQREHGMAPGTRIEVTNLFHPVPARLKFLKSDETEAAHIIRLVRLYAVSHPQVGFLLREDGREIFRSPGNVPLLDRVREIWGRQVGDEVSLMPVFERDGMRLSGLLGKPGVSRGTRQDLVTVVNGRPVDSRTMAFALTESYHTLIPKGRYPLAFAFLEIDPAWVDVNVHPAKREVRFRDEARVRGFLIQSVLSVLLTRVDDGLPTTTIPAITPTLVPSFVAPTATSGTAPLAVPSPTSTYVPPVSAPLASAPASSSSLRLSWRLLARLREERAVFETPTGLAILDIGAAHQRVLYEDILRQFSERKPVSQPLLVPLTIELEPLPAAVLKERMGLLQNAGFDFEEYGRNFWRVGALPVWLDPADALGFLRDLLAEMARREGDFGRPALAYDALARMAVNKARRKGDAMADGELLELVQALFRTAQPGTDPKGRRTFVEWTDATSVGVSADQRCPPLRRCLAGAGLPVRSASIWSRNIAAFSN
ncbi:DNA mismatch repair protein MutL [Verrucomicrobiota bacterium]|nr:DNA mismatch repair protein MutL [Verrucomicrobiota bacterium]